MGYGIVYQVTADENSPGGWDFFVSYTQADRAWAEWIAWILEEDGHRVLVQAWDFVPGTNWIHSMQAGTRDAARTIAVLSREYLTSVYGGAEWQAAWTSDPQGAGRKPLSENSCVPLTPTRSVEQFRRREWPFPLPGHAVRPGRSG